MAINPDLTRLRKEVARLLAEKRPDRYTVRDTVTDPDEDADPDSLEVEDTDEETSWLDDIADEVSDLVPDEEVRKLYARKIVGQEEGRATRRANGLLRKIRQTGQLVLTWFDVKDDPVSVVTRIVEPGKQDRIKEERVALRAMTPRDLRDFATEERRRAAGDFAARNATCEGAELVADWMTRGGFSRFQTWAEQELPTEDVRLMGRIDGTPQPDRHRDLGGQEIPPRHMRGQPGHHTDDTGGGSGGGSGGGKKRGSGFFLLPWWAEIGVLLTVLAVGGRWFA